MTLSSPEVDKFQIFAFLTKICAALYSRAKLVSSVVQETKLPLSIGRRSGLAVSTGGFCTV